MSQKKILIADDNAAIVDLMKIVLEREGCEVITTLNGKDILKLCEQKPDLIFLDIWMSGADGNDLCKQIKENEQSKTLEGQYEKSKISKAQILSYYLGENDFLFINSYYKTLKSSLPDTAKRRWTLNYLKEVKSYYSNK